ncbi:hypothetical protein I601_1025 [Nocardioides dokdonensis FR1436]|uniref:Uncharacterized protein n=1 Tax=Nocardioides dokdonensis FR1436 TaxID=1300347 RepID=A0A1A9GGP6_9ACTN|nr:helix-turn-helix domain-containing protein [Nocardioides dokdonensis]ANH37467.1 hypothetical protein I601_1025 [Nocardioides dokdonensis FR1436]
MTRRLPRSTASHGLALPARAVAEMREDLASVADKVVTAIINEVPSYDDALTGSMGENIRSAVRIALGGFLSLAGGRGGANPRTPTAPAAEGAYQLGRGEARNGRTTDALLSAYRIGARVSWREMSATAVRAGMDAETLAGFAELVFAYIDELSAASVAGHSDELATAGRVRQRLVERLARQLLTGAPAEAVLDTATRAEWEPPTTLTAVLIADSQVRPALASLPRATIAVVDSAELSEASGAPESTEGREGGLLLVPDAHGRARGALLRTIADLDAVAGPARPWLEVRASLDRARRTRTLGLGPDTEAHLPELVLSADADARADLRAAVLAPLADLRPGTAQKLTETLRSWLLHQGRRDDVAAELFVHAQTVRYRMGQLRELYGDDLEDPEKVLAMVIALG